MRVALLLLVLVNLLLFCWWQGLLDGWIPGGREPARIERQVAPERLSVLPMDRGTAGPGERGPVPGLADCHELGPLETARRDAVLALIQGLGTTTVRADAGETGIRVLIDATVAPEKSAEWLAAIAVEARQPARPCIPPSVPTDGVRTGVPGSGAGSSAPGAAGASPGARAGASPAEASAAGSQQPR